MSVLVGATAGVFLTNLPFGFWRAGTRRFSTAWFIAVHAPVPLVIAIRLLSGLGWRPITIPIFVAAFFAGQYLGGRLRIPGRRPTAADPETGGEP
jgi:hypothetical protein